MRSCQTRGWVLSGLGVEGVVEVNSGIRSLSGLAGVDRGIR